MIDMYDENDFPKLIPDGDVRFDFKNGLKRSPEMDFECSEFEYQCIVAAEEGRGEDSLTVEKYRKIRLKPDLNLTMPNKHLLKRNRSKILFVGTVSVVAAVAAAVLILFITGKYYDSHGDSEISGIENTVEIPDTKQNTNSVNELENTNLSAGLQQPVESQNSQNHANPAEKKSDKIPNRQHEERVEKSLQSESDNLFVINENQSFAPDAENIKNIESIREHIGLKMIDIAFVPPKSVNSAKIHIIHEQVKLEPYGLMDNLIILAENSATEINENKNKLLNIVENFSPTEILGKLGEKYYINRYIRRWKKQNQDIPLEIFADSSFENKIEEYYDENGKLIKAELYTNLSINNLNKYKNKIIN